MKKCSKLQGWTLVTSALIYFGINSQIAKAQQPKALPTASPQQPRVNSQSSQPHAKTSQRATPQRNPSARPSIVDTAKGTGVVAMFAEAQKLYNAGQYNEALVIYDKIVKKYPSHEPSIIQYGKTLYRLDRIPESYNLFARVNPQYLDAETSYEYGYSSYVVQRWDAALYGFKRVPADHALYDLANYYGALAAVKLKKYADAEDMLDKAVVLPDKLAKSRLLYQKHVQSLRHLQEKADLEQATSDEKNRLGQQKTKNSRPPGIKPASTPGNPTGYIHQGFLILDRFARLRVAQEHQMIDNHGFSQTTYDNNVGTFVFRHGPILPLPIKSYGQNKSAIGLQLDFEIEDRTTKGRQQRLVAYDNSRDAVVAQTTAIEPTHVTTGTAIAEPWVEFALPSGWWLGATGSLRFDYPKFERGQRTSTRSGTPHIGRKYPLGPHQGSILASYKFEQTTDSETEPLIDSSTAEFTTDVTFTTDTILTANAQFIHYNYQLPTLGGPDDIYSGKLQAEQDFPLGIVFRVNGTVAQQKNNIVRGLPTYDIATADGVTYSGSGLFVIAPFSWFEARAKYELAKTNWTVNQQDRAETFQKAVPDYVDQTTFSAALMFVF